MVPSDASQQKRACCGESPHLAGNAVRLLTHQISGGSGFADNQPARTHHQRQKKSRARSTSIDAISDLSGIRITLASSWALPWDLDVEYQDLPQKISAHVVRPVRWILWCILCMFVGLRCSEHVLNCGCQQYSPGTGVFFRCEPKKNKPSLFFESRTMSAALLS